jgi:hypothetical protein
MDVHDTRDGEELYRTLREEVMPLYYQRDRDGLPRGWIKCMKPARAAGRILQVTRIRSGIVVMTISIENFQLHPF